MNTVDRARALAADMRDWNANPTVSDFIDEQADEIERLTTLVRQQGEEVAITRERDEAKDAEIVRLRTALEQIVYVEGINPTAYKIARNALAYEQSKDSTP